MPPIIQAVHLGKETHLYALVEPTEGQYVGSLSSNLEGKQVVELLPCCVDAVLFSTYEEAKTFRKQFDNPFVWNITKVQ